MEEGKKSALQCTHSEICVVTEIPTDGKVIGISKTYVKCLLCNNILPINLVTRATIEVPLSAI